MENVNKSILEKHKQFYLEQLKNVLSFWEIYGFDKEHGGFFTCLDKDGVRFDHFKSVWAQGRGLYIFATAYKQIEQRESWLKIAKKTFDFIETHCFDQDGDMFFIVTKDGKGVQKRRYWYSESFACIGSAVLYSITGDRRHLDLARRTFDNIRAYYLGHKTKKPKYNPETLDLLALAPSMILLNTLQIMKICDLERPVLYQSEIEKVIETIVKYHYHPEKRAVFENVSQTGKIVDSPKGRLINPGHAIEAAWFLLDEARPENDLDSIAENIALWSIDLGWDPLYGGLLYFVDIDGRPTEQIEWDMKLWWPHSEALIALLKLYEKKPSTILFDKYLEIFEYTKKHFIVDKLEWIGYLHRDNTPSTYLKGNLFKGPYHIPRMLLMNYLTCERLLKK